MRQIQINRCLEAILSGAAAVAMAVAACGDDGSTPPAVCSESRTNSTEAGLSSDTVVVTVSGTLCGDDPQEVIIVWQPAETDTVGQQIQQDRYAVIGSAQPGAFDIRIPIGPVVQLLDGTELRPASDRFEVGFR